MTSSGGGVADLTNDLDWDEASETLRVLRDFFVDSGAMAEGWQINDVDGGFTAANERISVTFTLSAGDEPGRVEPAEENLTGRGEAMRQPRARSAPPGDELDRRSGL